MTDVKWEWPGSTIVRIVDGDTFVASVSRDLGFHGTATFDVKLRLNRINAPPAHSKDGAAAAVELATLIPPGSTADIETVGPYKYGDEWVAEVAVPGSPPVNVSDAMVASGHAQHWDGQGPRPGG